MERRTSRFYPQTWFQVVLLIVFCGVLYFINLSQWDLWNPDEPRYAHVAREMVQGGDWVLMHFNGNTYGDKPPLFFWLIALSSFLWQGFTSFSARFPSALFSTFTVLLTFFLGKRLYSARTGLLSALVLGTSVEFVYLATRANIDATLTFFTTAAIFCFVHWYVEMQEAGEGKKGRRILWIYGFYGAMALATLTKGPVGIGLPLLAALVYLAARKDWKGLKQMRLPSGLAFMLLLIFCWYGPALLRGGEEYLRVTLFKHTVDRYAGGWSHARPFYYFLINFPADFLPWTFFLPAAIVYGFSKDTAAKRGTFLFLLTWFAVIFLFFSFSKGKRGLYLLPLYPAASLMVGKLWEDHVSGQIETMRREWVVIPLYGLAGLLLMGGAGGLWVVFSRFPDFAVYALPVAVLLAACGVGMFFFRRSRRQGIVFAILVAAIGLGFFYTQRVIFPIVNPMKSARFICEEVTSRIQPGEKLAVYGGFGTGPYNFYTGIVPILELERKQDLFDLLKSNERVYCFLRFRDYASLKNISEGASMKMIARRHVGGDDIALISN